MERDDLKRWRQAMGFSQSEAAAELGVHVSTIENYERGTRREDNRPVAIPHAVALACSAIYHRIAPWHQTTVNVQRAKAEKKEQRKRFDEQVMRLAKDLDL